MENFLKDMKQIIIKGELSTYYISKDAKIYNTKTSRWIKGRMAPNGYWDFILNHGGKQHSFRAHRLVAEYFIPNPENKKQVNHIDGNKLNNKVENLEWVTTSENQIHAINNNLLSSQRKREYYKEDLENEFWKEIPNSTYLISSKGRVRNNKNVILKPKIDTGYERYLLTLIDGTKKTYLGHRLVYLIFNNKSLDDNILINHIDGNKMNNDLLNLEEMTQSENMLHSYYKSKTNSNTKPVIQYDLNMNFIAEYPSSHEAARQTNSSQSLISAACKRQGTSNGFNWRYK